MAYFGRDPYEEWRYQQELDAYYQQQQQAELAAQAQNQQASGVGETAGELGGAYIAEQAPNWFGFGPSAAATPVASAAAPAAASTSTLAATPAANAAWNAGATQAGGGLGGGGMGGAAVAVPAAVVAAIAINSMRTMNARKKKGTLTDHEINKIWDPVGTPINDFGDKYHIPGIGKKWDIGARIMPKIWGDNKYLSEWRRAQALRNQGINWNWTKDKQAHGLSKQELIDRAKKNNGNVKFAETRDEKYLTPDEIAGYATFGEKFGADWVDKYNTQQRRDIAQKVLNAGAAREHKGTIDVDWNKKGLQQEIDNYLKGIKGGTKKK